jgi:hypothetical protein
MAEVPQKRKKTKTSCDRCRARKTRCDGVQPICSSCSSRHEVCNYYTEDFSASLPLDTLSNIEERLSRLESDRARTTWNIPSTRHPAAGQVPPGRPLDVSSLPVSETSRASSGQDLFHEPLTSCPTADNAVTSFINTVQSLAQQNGERLRSSLPHTRHDAGDAYFGSFPSRTTALRLIDRYATHIHPLLPMLDLPMFNSRYNECWHGDRHGCNAILTHQSQAFHACLQMVFALGCLSGGDGSESELSLHMADAFYQQARRLLPLDCLDMLCLEAVQYSLLTANYLLYTTHTSRCHSAVGIAIRIAQSLRIDVSARNSDKYESREISRRVWASCMFMERSETSRSSWGGIDSNKNASGSLAVSLVAG